MFKILSLIAVVIQLVSINGLRVTSRDNNHRFSGIIEEDFAASFDVQTTYEDFGLNVKWNAKLPEKFDYHVAIESKSQDLAYCSGAIVEESGVQVVITAARCVEGHSANDLKIRYNSAEREIGGATVHVKNLWLPYGVDNNDPRLNVAVLYPVHRFNIRTPLRFPSHQNTYKNDAVVTGWPAVFPVSEHSNLLLYTKQTLLSESACGTHRGFLCAGVRSDATSYCYVTTGAPLVATNTDDNQKYLLGFLMADKGCRREITPTPYLDLALFENTKDRIFHQ